MLWRDENERGELDELLDETRDLLREAATVVDGSLGGAEGGADATILNLYDELRGRLDQVEDRRVKTLLERIARNVQRLSSLQGEVDRVQRLRDSIGRL